MTTYYLDPSKDYHNQTITPDEANSETLLEETIEHYDDCHQDYLFAWCNNRNLALHYGYWNENKPYNHHQALLNTNEELYKRAGILTSDHVLDAGCGLGGSALWMAEQHGNQVTGITLSDKQVAYAMKSAQKRNLQALTNFKMADYCQTPFEDESFDVIWAVESVCHTLNKADFIKEAYRLLRKGGRLAVSDAFMLQRTFTEKQWQSVMAFLNGWAVPNLSDRQAFASTIENTGFSITQIYDISKQVLPSSKHMYQTAKRLEPVQKISQFLGLRSKAQTANYNVGFAQYDFFHEKLAEYCMFVATK
ncbi:MAG: methyltransferase domain-containing protein [Methylococcales bacterium]|nr:methyltransferase domain-containing protein [Methylococcales bacterium]